MPEPDEEGEPRKEPSQDYFAGYYWGYHPYGSNELPGRKSDNELKDSIVERLIIKNMLHSNSITISTDNGAVIITGSVKTYAKRRAIGEEVWKTNGVVKVLNNLEVTKPETAGPGKIRNRKRMDSIPHY
jgi:hypothetical protein